MDLVDEQDAARPEVREQPGEVAGALDDRARGVRDLDARARARGSRRAWSCRARAGRGTARGRAPRRAAARPRGRCASCSLSAGWPTNSSSASGRSRGSSRRSSANGSGSAMRSARCAGRARSGRCGRRHRPSPAPSLARRRPPALPSRAERAAHQVLERRIVVRLGAPCAPPPAPAAQCSPRRDERRDGVLEALGARQHAAPSRAGAAPPERGSASSLSRSSTTRRSAVLRPMPGIATSAADLLLADRARQRLRLAAPRAPRARAAGRRRSRRSAGRRAAAPRRRRSRTAGPRPRARPGACAGTPARPTSGSAAAVCVETLDQVADAAAPRPRRRRRAFSSERAAQRGDHRPAPAARAAPRAAAPRPPRPRARRAEPARAVQVAERDRQRVGRVGRRACRVRPSRRRTMNATCSFDGRARCPSTLILISRGLYSATSHAALHRGHEQRAAHVAQHQRRADALVVERLLDRDHVGARARRSARRRARRWRGGGAAGRARAGGATAPCARQR